MIPDEDRLTCVACHERDAVPGSFLCEACCPVPEPEPEPVAWQPSLLGAA